MDIKYYLSLKEFREQRPNLAIMTDQQIQESINISIDLLDSLCNGLISQVLEYMNDRETKDPNHPHFRTDFELSQIKKAFVFQTQYTLNLNNDFTIGSGSFSSGGVNGAFQRPSNYEQIAPGVKEFLAKARVFNIYLGGANVETYNPINSNVGVVGGCSDITDKYLTRELANSTFLEKYQPDAEQDSILYIGENKHISFKSPRDMEFKMYKADTIKDIDGVYKTIDKITNLAYFGENMYNTMTRQEIYNAVWNSQWWRVDATYPQGMIIKKVVTIDGEKYVRTYYSLMDNNQGNNPETSTTWWEPLNLDVEAIEYDKVVDLVFKDSRIKENIDISVAERTQELKADINDVKVELMDEIGKTTEIINDVETRLTERDNELDTKIDTKESELKIKIDGVDTKLTTNINNLSNRVTEARQDLTNFKANMGAWSTDINGDTAFKFSTKKLYETTADDLKDSTELVNKKFLQAKMINDTTPIVESINNVSETLEKAFTINDKTTINQTTEYNTSTENNDLELVNKKYLRENGASVDLTPITSKLDNLEKAFSISDKVTTKLPMEWNFLSTFTNGLEVKNNSGVYIYPMGSSAQYFGWIDSGQNGGIRFQAKDKNDPSGFLNKIEMGGDVMQFTSKTNVYFWNNIDIINPNDKNRYYFDGLIRMNAITQEPEDEDLVTKSYVNTMIATKPTAKVLYIGRPTTQATFQESLNNRTGAGTKTITYWYCEIGKDDPGWQINYNNLIDNNNEILRRLELRYQNWTFATIQFKEVNATEIKFCIMDWFEHAFNGMNIEIWGTY